MTTLHCNVCGRYFESPIGDKKVEGICPDCQRSFTVIKSFEASPDEEE